MPTNKEDRVNINFGPTKYNSNRSATLKAKQQSTDTQDATVQNIVNNPTFNFAGGSGVATQGTVTSYSITTNNGAATLVTGPSVTFINGTGVFLVSGDVVALLVDTEGTYVAIAIISRAGTITPGVIPGVNLITGYPIQTDSSVLTYYIQGALTESNIQFCIDSTGNFGYNTDAIFGFANLASSIRSVHGINTVSSTNISLGTVGSTSATTRHIYTNPSGVMFVYETWSNNTNILYKNTSSGAFTSLSTSTVTSNLIAYDYSNGSLWFRNGTGWYRWLNGDTTATLTTLTGTYTQFGRIVAGNGYLFGYDSTNSKLYRKASNTADDWTLIYTGILTSGNFYAAGPDGKLYVIYESGNYVRIDRIGPSGIEQFNTGIDGTLGAGYVRPMGLCVNSDGICYFTMVQRADLLGGGGTSSQYGIGLYACNFSTTALLAADATMYQSVNVTFTYSNGLQINNSKIYWIHGYQGSGLTTTFKMYAYDI